MTLKEVRTKFVEESGRFDLVVDRTDYADNGADWYIKTGQKYLDSKIDTHKSVARYHKDIAAGDIKLELLYCRAIQQVWVTNADGRSELTKKSMKWLRTEYGYDFASSEIDQGTPLYYTPAILGLSPEQAALTAENYTDEFTYEGDDIKFGDHYSYNGILFMPPSDGVYTLSIFGLFDSYPLSSDDAKNFWTELHPDLLIRAAMWALEFAYRNRQGMLDAEEGMRQLLLGIDYNLAEEDIAGGVSMERAD